VGETTLTLTPGVTNPMNTKHAKPLIALGICTLWGFACSTDTSNIDDSVLTFDGGLNQDSSTGGGTGGFVGGSGGSKVNGGAGGSLSTGGAAAGGTGVGSGGTAGTRTGGTAGTSTGGSSTGGTGQGGTGGTPVPATVGVGKICGGDIDCGLGQTCIDEGEGWPRTGYCSQICAGDDECGKDAFCSDELDDEGTRLCFQRCANNTCARPGLVCASTVSGIVDLGGKACIPGRAAAKDGDVCAGLQDCNGGQLCVSNPFSMPTGMCVTVGCTVGDNTTCAVSGDGVCLPLSPTVGLCIDSCANTNECRTAENHICKQPEGLPRGFCGPNVKEVGDACGKDTDCGPAPWQCLEGPRFPGGYCGARGCNPSDESTCPFDSTCFDPTPGGLPNDQYCVAECDRTLDCRSGYLCETFQANNQQKGCVLDPRQ
jgi:hypothetical protein